VYQSIVTGFSRRPQDVDAAKRFLIPCVDRDDRDLPTYGEVAAAYGGIARAVGPVLNSIARDCEAAQEPDLTALVVDKGTRLPGTFLGQPVIAGTASETRWHHELARIRRHAWGG
jgi:hypothetical protein